MPPNTYKVVFLVILMGFNSICSQCKKHKKVFGRHDLCKKCLDNNFQKHIQSMKNKSGASYEKWVDKTSKAMQRAKAKLKRDKKKLSSDMSKVPDDENNRPENVLRSSQKPVSSLKQAKVKNTRPDKL